MNPSSFLPDRIRQHRRFAGDDRRGWTQEELAARMTARGIAWDRTTVTKIETHRRPVTVDELVHLAALFQDTITHLLDPKDDQ